MPKAEAVRKSRKARTGPYGPASVAPARMPALAQAPLPQHDLASLSIHPPAPVQDAADDAMDSQLDDASGFAPSDPEEAREGPAAPIFGPGGAVAAAARAVRLRQPALHEMWNLPPRAVAAGYAAAGGAGAPAQHYFQTHLGVRSDPRVAAAHRAQIATAGGRVPQRARDAALAVAELHDRAFGAEASARNPGLTAFKKAYREPTVALNDDSGGSGFDEMISTSMTAGFRARLQPHLPSAELDDVVGLMSQARIPTHELTWVHDTGVPAPAAAPPLVLAGHPGSVSKSATDMRRGITSEHGTRNALRATALDMQFNADFPGVTGAAAGGARSAAAKKLVRNLGLVGNAYTVEHMMAPASVLNQVNAGVSPDSYSARHGELIKNQALQPGFHAMVRANHNARERLKIHTAAGLVNAGHASLVHPAMTALLEEGGNDPDVAVERLHDGRHVPPPAQPYSFPPAVASLAALSLHNAVNPAAPHHLIGPPLPMLRPGAP